MDRQYALNNKLISEVHDLVTHFTHFRIEAELPTKNSTKKPGNLICGKQTQFLEKGKGFKGDCGNCTRQLDFVQESAE